MSKPLDCINVLMYHYTMTSSSLQTSKAKKLTDALLTFETREEMAAFLRDLLTEAEIEEFSDRFTVATELAKGKPQRAVSAQTGVSIATVTRVNQWLTRGMGGYRIAIERLKAQELLKSNSKHHHRKA